MPSRFIITVNILQNQAPTGSGASVEVDAGASVSGNISAEDKENDNLTYEVTEQGNKGTAYVDPNTGEEYVQMVDIPESVLQVQPHLVVLSKAILYCISFVIIIFHK